MSRGTLCCVKHSIIIQSANKKTVYRMPQSMFFAYFGPSRRSDYRVVEIRLDFDLAELSELPQQATDARQLLIDAGFLSEEMSYFDEPCLDDRMSWYSILVAQTALLFQRRNGHRV